MHVLKHVGSSSGLDERCDYLLSVFIGRFTLLIGRAGASPPSRATGAIFLCISYVTAVRYVAAINHEARGRAAPEGE